ncbi:MAG: RNA methyltransferase [Clostridia bacterium]|nr:RNA methyltransferase [Clostridia bacterium]
MEIITSLKNPRVALWRSLKRTSVRRECGLFLVEGDKSVAEALESGFEAEAVLLDTDRPVPENLDPDLPLVQLPAHVLAAVCDTKTPQGIAAIMRMAPRLVTGKRIVALDGVQDPGNVGTIIRTADAAGLDGVLLSADCADPYGPKVLRATMGSVFHLPVEVTDNLPRRLKEYAVQGIPVISSQLDGTPFDAWKSNGAGFVLVIGSEGNGVSDPIRALATDHLCLPMRGKAESLNAAVAAGIMMYALMRDQP